MYVAGGSGGSENIEVSGVRDLAEERSADAEFQSRTVRELWKLARATLVYLARSMSEPLKNNGKKL